MDKHNQKVTDPRLQQAMQRLDQLLIGAAVKAGNQVKTNEPKLKVPETKNR